MKPDRDFWESFCFPGKELPFPSLFLLLELDIYLEVEWSSCNHDSRNIKERDTDIRNRLLDSVGEGENGMI